MPIPPTVTFQGEVYEYDSWANENVDMMDCNNAAKALKLNMTGQQAVRRLVEYVEDHGPARGMDIIRGAFGVLGHPGIPWTDIFKYACTHRQLLHYKIDRKKQGSPALFAFAHQLSMGSENT